MPVIPVLVQDAGVPLAPSLPEPLKRLAALDAHDLSDERWSYDIGRLINATEKLAGSDPIAAPVTPRGRRNWCRDRRSNWSVLLIASASDVDCARWRLERGGDLRLGS